MLIQKIKVAGTVVSTYSMRRCYNAEAQYAKVLEDLLHMAKGMPEGRETRSGKVHAKFDACIESDLSEAFPLLHGKKVATKSVIAELCGFLKGCTSAEQFRALGTKIWDANANETKGWLMNPARTGTDDLGRIYGAQWTDWPRAGCQSQPINQVNQLISNLVTDPYERGHIVSAWNVGELHLMALKPCHVMYQCFVDGDDRLSLKMYQRSADWFLGVPFNILSYSLLLLWLCQKTGYSPGKLKIEFGDYHLYDNHIEAAMKYLEQRDKLEAGSLSDPFLVSVVGNQYVPSMTPSSIVPAEPSHFAVTGYRPMPSIPAPMAP